MAGTTIGRKPIRLGDLERSGDLDGYRSLTADEERDKQDDVIAADKARCCCCGQVSCGTFRGFIRQRPGASYRAFAICYACGHSNEF